MIVLQKKDTNVDLPFQPPAASAELLAYYRTLSDFLAGRLNLLRILPVAKAEGVSRQIRFLQPESSLAISGLAPFDADLVAENFAAIMELLLAVSPANSLAKAVKEGLDAGDFGKKCWLGDLAEIEREFGRWAEMKQVDGDSLIQLVHWAFSPFWRLAAEQYADDLKELVTNERPTCPICGKHPDFAVLDERERGRRQLVCLTCNLQWPFKRMGCAYCGNTDYHQLGYLVIDEVPGYRIYHCEKCLSYLKTFDQRADAIRLDGDPLLENVKTLFMDMLAIEKGYLPMYGQD
jgi:FdhE protein